MHLQASLWNFVLYNVAGGGDSALYGVEPPSFYLRNGANQLAAVLPLAVIAFPLVAGWQWLRGLPGRPAPRALIAAAPVYLWLGALSMLPHKEERFLYVVYPLVGTARPPHVATNLCPAFALPVGCHYCAAATYLVKFPEHVARCSWTHIPGLPAEYASQLQRIGLPQMCMTAGLVLAALPDLAAAAARAAVPPEAARQVGRVLAAGLLLATTALSLSRIAALTLHYGAPMRVYRALPLVGITSLFYMHHDVSRRAQMLVKPSCRYHAKMPSRQDGVYCAGARCGAACACLCGRRMAPLSVLLLFAVACISAVFRAIRL